MAATSAPKYTHSVVHAACCLLILFAICPKTEALRRFTPDDAKIAKELNRKAASADTTSYGQPVAELTTKLTSVDHFGSVQYSRNDTYSMRYILIWPETKPNASSPIYLFCAQEVTLPEASPGAGFYSALANSTGALQIWPEHRYYANSAPYTPTDQFAHFTIEQALVDHVELVLYVQNMFNLTTNPVIAIGSSYSGQLSSYLRMRYPDVIAGAISSSPTSFGCPGLGLDPSYDPYGFAKVATRTASSEGGSAAACPANVQKFFQTILSLGASASGRKTINTDMSLCSDSTLASDDDVQNLALYVQNQWTTAAQYNAPIADLGLAGVPAYRVRVACNYFKSTTLSTTQLLSNMVSALAVFNANTTTSNGCLDVTGATAEPEPEAPGTAEPPSVTTLDVSVASPEAEPEPNATPEPSSSDKFAYQVCNQDQTPVSFDGVTDMFFDFPFDLDANDKECVQQYGIHSQYNWAAYNFGLSAVRQSSNIFFTNGIYDPFVACGPTVNISATITAAVYEGCHAYDVGTPYPEDPPSVTAARNQGAALIAQWVKQYNTVKTQIPLSNAANMFDLSYSLGGYTQVVNDTLTGSTSFRDQQVLNSSASYSNSVAAMM
ncbi:TPA: hypothetical protein ACH3X2_012961 [Trebouxia sp. C0005]